MCTNLKSEKDVNEKPLLVIILQVLLHMLWKGERPCEKISYVCVLGKDHCSPFSSSDSHLFHWIRYNNI